MSELTQHLARQLAALDRGRVHVCVAFSGGLDSTALLHALAALRAADHLAGLRAVHVDHRLQPASADWGDHCRRIADALDLRCDQLPAGVIDPRNGGLEAAARDARYRALRKQLAPGELLATAHHRGDLAETVLLRALRGSGPAGLAGIREFGAFGAGYLWRPLLALPRATLLAHVQAAGLDWCEDPSNLDTAFERNYLRHEVLPVLQRRWPEAERALERVATLCRESGELLDDLARIDLLGAARGDCLDLAALRRLSPARARNLVRFFLRRAGLRPPGGAVLDEGLRQLLEARCDASPRLSVPGGELRRYRDAVHLLPAGPAAVAAAAQAWNGEGWLELPRGGRMRLEPQADGGIDARILEKALSVRYRQGGERLRRPGHRHSQSLKKLFQAAGVPPWDRERTPLLYAEDDLVAAGGRWVSADYSVAAGRPGLRLHWLEDDAAAG